MGLTRKWRELVEYLEWNGEILDLRLLALTVWGNLVKVNARVAQSATNHYFDLGYETGPSHYNDLVRAREVLYAAIHSMVEVGDLYHFIDSIRETEGELIDAICGIAETVQA